MSTSKGQTPPNPSKSELSEEEKARRRALNLPEDAPEEAVIRRELDLPLDAPDELVEAAQGHVARKDEPEGDKQDIAVLDFLLGPTTPLEYDVDTFIDTPEGRGKLTFHLKQLDDKKIDDLEKEHSTGEGPFRVVDRPSLNAALVAEATMFFQDPTGKVVVPGSKEFRGPIPSAADALRGRFKFQPGVISMVAEEVRAAAGMTNDRVGAARLSKVSGEQVIANAVGNS